MNFTFINTLFWPFGHMFTWDTSHVQPFHTEVHQAHEVVRIGTTIIFYLSKLWNTKLMFSILCDVIFLVRLQGKMWSWSLMGVKGFNCLVFLWEGTLFIGGGVDSWGFRGEGHQWNFGVMGKGTRLLNLWKSREVHALRYKKHKICKISNAFSAIQGAQISKFPRGTCPQTPLAPECFNVHASPISLYETCVPHSMVHRMHIFHCKFLTNLSQFGTGYFVNELAH